MDRGGGIGRDGQRLNSVCVNLRSVPPGCVADRIMAPKDVNVLTPKTCEYVTSHGKKDSAHVMKLSTWRWELIVDYPGSGRNVTTRVPVRGRQARHSQRTM